MFDFAQRGIVISFVTLGFLWHPAAVLSGPPTGDQAVSNQDYVIVVDGVSVGKHGKNTNSGDTELRYSKERMATKSALERKSEKPVGFHIDFAPDSSVMSAEGSEELNLIASAIELIPNNPTFEINVSTNIRTKDRSPERLALDRAYAIAAHLKANKRLKNKLILVVGDKSTARATSSLAPKLDTQNNVFFVNKGSS